MKHVALGLLCLFLLLPVSAAADSLDSITPSSFVQFTPEQSATLTGTNLFGNLYGAPDDSNIFLTTQIQVDGPTGTFTQPISGGFRDTGSGIDTIYMTISDATLAVVGHYSVMVIATDTTGYRAIGPVYYDVVAPPPPAPQNPLIFVPEVVFAVATSASGATAQFSVNGFSFVDPPPAPTITCDHNSGDLFPIGETIVNCTATDSFGSASASFPVFVLDVVAPVVTVPADILTSSSNPVVTYTASAVDAVNGSVPVTCDPASGSTFPVGTTVVTCVAYDAQDNVGIAQFNVTVSNGPVLTLPSNISVECTGPAGAPVSFTVTATDNATISCTPASGSTFPLGTTTVNCTATSAVTGTTSGSFTVTVGDTTPPSISSVTATPNSLWPPNGRMVPVTVAVSVADICDPTAGASCHIVSVSSNEPSSSPEWEITGPLTVNLVADRLDTGTGRVYTITVQCTDASGNATTRTVTVRVAHDQGN